MTHEVTEAPRPAAEAIPPMSRGGMRYRGYSVLGLIRRRPRAVALAGLLALVVGVGGTWWLHERLTHVEENDAQVAGEVTTIASRLDGWLIARPVMEGDHVRKGQVLAEIDSRDARLRLVAKQASLAADIAQIAQIAAQRDTVRQATDAAIGEAKAQVNAAEATVATAQHQQDLANADFKRADSLVGSGYATRQTWDRARTALLADADAVRQAQAVLASRRAALAQATAQAGQVEVLSRQIEVLASERDGLAAQVDQLRQEISDRTLRAPFDGIVDRTFIHEGDFVQPGQWLMMMHDPNDVWVEAKIKETAIGEVRVGQPVAVTVDAYPGLKLSGRVFRVGNAATNQFALLPSPNPSGNFTKITQRVPVRVALDKLPRPLQPGLMAEVSIDVGH